MSTFRGLLVLSCVIACFSSEARPLDPLSTEEIEARLGEFDDPGWNGEVKVVRDVTEFGCEYTRETIAVPARDGGTRKLKLEVVKPAGVDRTPVVILVPTIEGISVLEPSVAFQLCKRGLSSIIADVNDPRLPSEYPSWGLEDANNGAAVRSLRVVLDYARSQPRFEAENVGVMGLSLGGLTASLFAGVEGENLKALVVVVGGGNVPYCLATSDYVTIAELRVRRMEAENLETAEAYEDVLRSNVRHDPIHFAARVPRENAFLVMAEKDKKIPFVAQTELFTALGRPRSKTFSKGHVDSLVRLTYLYMDSVEEFFLVRFGKQPEGYTTPEHEVIELSR